MMMKHKKLAAALFAAVTACTMFRAIPAEADKIEVNPDNYDLDESCVNIVSAKENQFDPRDTEFRLDSYDVELWNVKEGIRDIELTLYYPEVLKIVPTAKGEPAKKGTIPADSDASFVLDEENHSLKVSVHSEQPIQTDGILFSVIISIPADVKSLERYPIKTEVQEFSGASGDIVYNIVDGYIEIAGIHHDDMRFEKGDMNFTRSVGVDDVQQLLKEYVTTLSGRASALPEDHRKIADIDEDGNVDIIDVQLLLKYYTEQTARKDITWEEILGKRPQYPAVHVSNETFYRQRDTEREAAE